MIVCRGGRSDRPTEQVGNPRLLDVGLSIVHPFFNERARFDLQFENWLSWPEEIRRKVQIIIVDDCSPSPVHTWLTKSKLKRVSNLNLAIYRITTDLEYNTPGALNLAFTVAPSKFVLTMDSDCAFDVDNIQRLVDMTPVNDGLYKFNRTRIGSGENSINWEGKESREDLKQTRYLPCTMLMNQNLFWRLGGFDEDYTGSRSGGYGMFDTDFDDRMLAENIMWYIKEDVIVTEWMPSVCDGEIITRNEKSHEVARDLHRLKHHFNPARKAEWLYQNREILRFQWERTFWGAYGS